MSVQRSIVKNVSVDRSRKLTSMEKCEAELLTKLAELKKELVLHHSLIPKSHDFEVLEFYGDSVLSEKVSFLLIQTRRFMNPHLLTESRTAIVFNENLARVFDALQLYKLLDVEKEMSLKEKADVVEAIIGELSEATKKEDNASQSAKIKLLISSFISYICFCGEESKSTIESNGRKTPQKTQRNKSPQKEVKMEAVKSVTPSHEELDSSSSLLAPTSFSKSSLRSHSPRKDSASDFKKKDRKPSDRTSEALSNGKVTILQRPLTSDQGKDPESDSNPNQQETPALPANQMSWEELVMWSKT